MKHLKFLIYNYIYSIKSLLKRIKKLFVIILNKKFYLKRTNELTKIILLKFDLIV